MCERESLQTPLSLVIHELFAIGDLKRIQVEGKPSSGKLSISGQMSSLRYQRVGMGDCILSGSDLNFWHLMKVICYRLGAGNPTSCANLPFSTLKIMSATLQLAPILKLLIYHKGGERWWSLEYWEGVSPQLGESNPCPVTSVIIKELAAHQLLNGGCG